MTAKRAIGLAVAALIALGMFPVVSTQPGADAVAVIQGFLEFYSGVFALLSFTGAVLWGLLAAERIAPPRYRLLAQGIHRAFGMLGLGFLGTHIVLQILAERATVIDAVIPFLDTRNRLVATGLGTIAADLMIVVFAIGAMRGRFAASSRPWVWRVLHGIAYLSWPIAITHGLSAGRPPAGWVTASYAISLVAVLIAVVLRLFSPFPAMRAARRLRREFADLTADLPGRGERPRRAEPPPEPPKPQREPATQPFQQVDPDADPYTPTRRRVQPLPPTPSMPRERTPIREQPPPIRQQPQPSPLRRERERPPMPEPVREPLRTREPLQPAAAVPGVRDYPRPRVVPEPTLRTATPPATAAMPAPPAAPTRERPVPDDRPVPARPQPQPDDDDLSYGSGLLERFGFRRRPQRERERPLIEPDMEEVEFWAALRAETSVWIRRGRR